MYRKVLGCAALLALAGCGGGGGHKQAAAGAKVKLVPFQATPPTALAAPVSPAPPCRAAQLRVTGKGLLLVPGASEGGTGTLVLRNRGPRACSLAGRPAARFVGGTAPPPQRQHALPPQPLEFPRVAPPSTVLRALAPGRSAVLSLDWSNWCPRAGAAHGGRLQPPKALRLTLPRHGGAVDAGYSSVVPCDHPGRPSTIGMRPFAPEPLTAAGGFTNVPLTVTAHPLGGGTGALRARRGQDLRFAVDLRNRSTTETVRFDGRCPLLAEKFAPVGPTEAHQLNCGAAAPIAPGKSQWFEMRVHVPGNAPLGPNGLFWRLDPVGDFGPQVVARVFVQR